MRQATPPNIHSNTQQHRDVETLWRHPAIVHLLKGATRLQLLKEIPSLGWRSYKFTRMLQCLIIIRIEKNYI